MPKLSAEQVRSGFIYDPETGSITKKRNGNSVFHCKDRDGYTRITFLGTSFAAHQIAFACYYGRWPEGQIDHINGDKQDNRIKNLRDIPQRQNLENLRAATRRNTSGLLGVSIHHGKWRAKIQVDKKEIVLGRFDSKEEAHAAYVEAKRRLHSGCSL